MRTVHGTKLLLALLILVALMAAGAWLAFRVAAPAVRSFLNPEVTVTIPEGITSLEIDEILADAGVTETGQLAAISARDSLEGYLFPDTYRFHRDTPAAEAVSRLTANFELKAVPIIGSDTEASRRAVIVASILEREVRDPADQRIVAGIIGKRMEAGIPLQVDATLCYVKRLESGSESCYPITRVDLTNPSPYNTYLYRGLPPGPIGNPGASALSASIDPQPSPYWFYLSDPATSRTIFSSTNDEHEANKDRYLR